MMRRIPHGSWVNLFVFGYVFYFVILILFKCSAILLPGIAIMSSGFLAVMYGLVLCYLFLGISIVADIFMGAIEQITS